MCTRSAVVGPDGPVMCAFRCVTPPLSLHLASLRLCTVEPQHLVCSSSHRPHPWRGGNNNFVHPECAGGSGRANYFLFVKGEAYYNLFRCETPPLLLHYCVRMCINVINNFGFHWYSLSFVCEEVYCLLKFYTKKQKRFFMCNDFFVQKFSLSPPSKKSPLFTRITISSSVDLRTILSGHKFYLAYSHYMRVRDDSPIRVCEKRSDHLREKWTKFSSFANSFHSH
jgi:hypothetical protein